MNALRGIAAAFVIAAGCSGDSPPVPGAKHRVPTPLIDGLSSYQSVEQAKAALSGAGPWRVVEDSKPSPGRGVCSQFEMYTIAAEWSHLSHDGELQLQFVNGVLYGSSFYPKHPGEYRASLSATGLSFSERDIIGAPSTHVEPRTRVWHWTAYDDRRYTGWEDLAVSEEIAAWIRACS